MELELKGTGSSNDGRLMVAYPEFVYEHAEAALLTRDNKFINPALAANRPRSYLLVTPTWRWCVVARCLRVVYLVTRGKTTPSLRASLSQSPP
jgi:hypothetical protein